MKSPIKNTRLFKIHKNKAIYDNKNIINYNYIFFKAIKQPSI